MCLKWRTFVIDGCWNCREDCVEQDVEVLFFWHSTICRALQRCATSFSRCIHNWEFDLLFICSKIKEQFIRLINNFSDT